MPAIADTGVIVALLARNDPFHSWAVDAFRSNSPFITCEAVIVEAASFFPEPRPVLKLIERGDLVLQFHLSDNLTEVMPLVAKYADRPMDLADACIVRMSELERDTKVWTVDRSDFSVYRRNGNELIPCAFPPGR